MKLTKVLVNDGLDEQIKAICSRYKVNVDEIFKISNGLSKVTFKPEKRDD